MCVPLSSTNPLLRTKISSALTTVDNRWAIIRDVESLMMDVILFIIVSSVERSNEEVASSKMYKEGRFNKTLAMAILCFSPPESFSPLSPTTVS